METSIAVGPCHWRGTGAAVPPEFGCKANFNAMPPGKPGIALATPLAWPYNSPIALLPLANKN